MKAVDLTGRRFGRLMVLRLAPSRNGRKFWFCYCDCGSECEVTHGNLQSGNTISCGCARRLNTSNVTHGATRGGAKRLYTTWHAMKSRCYYPGNNRYRWYGARGIVVCDEWLKFEAFEAWALASGYQDHLTIDRIDPDAGYSPENCRWITKSENSRVKRRPGSVTGT